MSDSKAPADSKTPDRKTFLAQKREDAVDAKRDELCFAAESFKCLGGDGFRSN